MVSPVEEIQKGIKSGVRKVNIDTDNRLAITAAIREAAMKDPAKLRPLATSSSLQSLT